MFSEATDFVIVKTINHRSTGITTAIAVNKKDNCKYIIKFADLLLYQGYISVTNESKFIDICKSDNIVQSKGEIITDTHKILILEYCEHGDLFEVLETKIDFSHNYIEKILKSVLQGLIVVHSKGIVHNDVKLENIFVTKDDEMRLGDFGLSFFENNPKTIWDGTPSYLPPEFRSGPLTCKIDIWSIGVLIYILFTRSTPFGESVKHVYNRHRMLPYHNSYIPEKYWNIIVSCFQIDHTKRPTAEEVLSQI
jgi:serine/threonine protein kinase